MRERRRTWGLLLASAAIVVGAAAFFGSETVIALVERVWSRLAQAPAPIFFGVMVVAILLPAPVTPFYLTAGPIFGVAESLLWVAFVLAVNALVVHGMAASVLRPFLERIVEGRGLRIPRLERPEDQHLFLLVMRVTPGIPYFVQSWAVALAGIDRVRFVIVTVAVQMVYATGFVVLGRAAFAGRLGGVVFALAFLVVAGGVARVLHRRLSARTDDEATQVEAASD